MAACTTNTSPICLACQHLICWLRSTVVEIYLVSNERSPLESLLFPQKQMCPRTVESDMKVAERDVYATATFVNRANRPDYVFYLERRREICPREPLSKLYPHYILRKRGNVIETGDRRFTWLGCSDIFVVERHLGLAEQKSKRCFCGRDNGDRNGIALEGGARLGERDFVIILSVLGDAAVDARSVC